ncbi:hypothetical protein ACTOB_000923 [Actinoplanes oblitus]|uniref:Uncharacterized protein n=1 Tax=Actinoplanes oblitus TaxID=3040509 RepID=A0ABY8WKM6_9ACTN|nr:hypothetical protein [Actinoplanes oblitus]WIM97407.1 hypothetical protein ACTOB_000923 [Actinoplanes oblitus]
MVITKGEGLVLRKTKAALAVAAGLFASLAIVPQAASAASPVACKMEQFRPTKGGINGTISLTMCRRGHYVEAMYGGYENESSEYSHTGRIVLEDNRGRSWISPITQVRPGDEIRGNMENIQRNWDSGQRVCAHWEIVHIPKAPIRTPGYACWAA